jgi:phenylalanine-4-hydroxylase
MARFYWWTVEYGLVGSPRDFRLYGAGLLSSLAETDAMFNGQARVIPFSEAALERSIEFSDPQNVYFVARDYEQLNDALTSLVDPPRSLLATRH